MYKEIVIHIASLIFINNPFYYKKIRLNMSDPMGDKWLGDIEYDMFSDILSKFKKFKFENLSKISITKIMSVSDKYDFKFELKRKENLSIILKFYQKCNVNDEWEELEDLEFLNSIDNLALLTKLK